MTTPRNDNRDYIVFLGESTFPAGLAAIQRMTLMAKALLNDGFGVMVVCRKGGSRGKIIDFPSNGNFEGIEYVYTSGNILRPKNFLKRNLLKIKGIFGEFIYLYSFNKRNKITAAIISNHSAFHVFRYRIFSLIIGFPIILNFVEMASSMKGRERLLTKINDYIFDYGIIKIVDGALPISNKLVDYYRQYSPSKPYLKLPILCDFEKFDVAAYEESETIFMYSGAASYLELIDFLIIAFDQLTMQGDTIILQLILGGGEAELNRVKKRIGEALNKDHIRLTTNVPHKDIPKYYSMASALLIPLRPTVQDEARFPHKIGEYLAAGKPMITTGYGEINNYDFIDGENVLIADEYDPGDFADKMNFVINNPSVAKSIGIEGRQMGYKNFNYTNFGKDLRKYFAILKPDST
ncbi:glycosyltransferase [Muriicola sp. Z0-33]|uniref:glycosyltransferase n=1 Tax=Muriicola sp. Z0-33 TaxID=2816957 RepID=UPI002238BCDE|nr:glycosyltransferase [Muriicola sp. Z0-33]MCW5515664.1 glycosyltransferase [Muriicola sp. Z0-33]